MRKSLIALSLLPALAAVGVPTLANAQSQRLDVRPLANQLTEDEIAKIFSDNTFDGAYNFSRDGNAQSFYRERHNPDGTVFYQEGRISANGQWAVQDDTLCFAYDHPLMQGGCFRVYRIENCFYFYTTTVPRVADELDRDYWVARATKNGEEPLCEAAFT